MPPIHWQQSMAIDHGTIDKQHQRWIKLYNDLDKLLLEATPSLHGRIKIDALQAMQEYALYHFRYEENYMKSIGYPEVTLHWRLHKDFNYKIFEYIRRIETGGVVLNTEIISIIRSWMLNHIQMEDMKIRDFAESRLDLNQRG